MIGAPHLQARLQSLIDAHNEKRNPSGQNFVEQAKRKADEISADAERDAVSSVPAVEIVPEEGDIATLPDLKASAKVSTLDASESFYENHFTEDGSWFWLDCGDCTVSDAIKLATLKGKYKSGAEAGKLLNDGGQILKLAIESDEQLVSVTIVGEFPKTFPNKPVPFKEVLYNLRGLL